MLDGSLFLAIPTLEHPAWRLRVDGQEVSPGIFSRYRHQVEIWHHGPEREAGPLQVSQAHRVGHFPRRHFPPQQPAAVTSDLHCYGPEQAIHLLYLNPQQEPLVLQLRRGGQIQLEKNLPTAALEFVTFPRLPEGNWSANLFSATGEFRSQCGFIIGPPKPLPEPRPRPDPEPPPPEQALRFRFDQHGYAIEHWIHEEVEGYRYLPVDPAPGPELKSTPGGIRTHRALVLVSDLNAAGPGLEEVARNQALAHYEACCRHFSRGPLRPLTLPSTGELVIVGPGASTSVAPCLHSESPPPAPTGGPASTFQICRWVKDDLMVTPPCLVRAYQLVDGQLTCSRLELMDAIL